MSERPSYRPQFDFSSSPTVARFLDRDEFVRMLIGPVGSGKTTACCVDAMRIAAAQDVDSDGWKRSRIALIRNTSPELKQTTIKSWLECWPEDKVGSEVRYSSPITHRIIRKPRGGYPGLDAEFIFVPLDKPGDVKKLLSFELTAAYINEVSEMPRAIVQMLRGRVGRFPAFDRQTGYQARRVGVFGDTNPPDEDHWLASLDMHERPAGWSFDRQPPAVLEVDPVETRPAGDGYLQGSARCREPEFKGQVFEGCEIVSAADRFWIQNPYAENLVNLLAGYYTRQQLPGARLDWIRRYLQGRYGFVQEGKPVVPDYVDEVYARDELPLLQGVPLQLGLDVGGGTLQPAAVFLQRHPRGAWLAHAEVVAPDHGLKRFTDEIIRVAHTLFPGMEIEVGYGDPAGTGRDELYEVAAFDHLRSRGVPAQPAHSNKPHLRIEAVNNAVGRFIDGKPGLLVHKRCGTLRKALAGGWHFKRVQIAGEERYHDIPNKNHPYSDVGDALGYGLLGGGEAKDLRFGGREPVSDPFNAVVDFDLW